MINIYNIDGRILMQAPVTKEAKREEEMSKSDYISLSFNSDVKVTLPAGSYIVHTYYIDSVRKVTRHFLLLDPYEPEQTDEMSWKYAPEFQHPKMILGKVPFYINTKNSQNEDIKQTNWSFVGTPDAIMTYICDFLNKDLQFGSCGWKSVLTGKLKNSLNVSFSDNDVLSLLSAVANAAGDKCEWHIDYDNEVIYLGNVVIGDSGYKLKVGENVGVSSVSASKEEFYNSFTVFGGSRNITQTNNKGENISSGDIRLQLPVRNGNIHLNNKDVAYTIDKFSVIDIRQNKQSEPLLTKVLNFSDIYPSLNTYVYRVRGREKYVMDSETNKKVPLITNPDGSVASYKTFTVWYMQLAYCTTKEEKDKKLVNTTVDEGVKHYWYAFELSENLLVNGKTPSCSFEPNFEKGALSSPLCGRGTNGEYVGFQLHYHKNNETVHDSDDVSSSNFVIYAGDYEIIYQEESNLIIPTNLNEGLVPKGENLPSLRCNIVVLYNIAMSNKYQEEAQEKLLDKTIDEIKRLSSDLNNYTCKSYPQVFEEKNPRLQIGQRVIYNDGQGYELETRVLKLSTNIDYDIIQEITVGNQTLKGTITQLKEDVQSIISNGNSSGSQGGYTVSQINRLIAQYGIRYFLSKTDEDTAQKAITFMEGLKLGKDGKKGLSGDGNAVLGDVVVDRAHDPHSTEADRTIIGAQGFDLYMGADGKSHLYIDYLTTRVKMFAAGAEIRKVSYSGGTTIFSNAGSTIVKVAYVMDANGEKVIAYKCYAAADDGTTRTMNWWRPGMMAMCQTFNVKAQTEGELANRYYWRLVVAVGQETLEDGRLYDYVVLSNVERFYGREKVVPSYGLKLLADGTGKVLTFGGAAVAVAAANGLTSFGAVLEQDGVKVDDYDFSVSGRNYAGYEPAERGGEPVAPMAGDVIVQVGDQVKWLSRGNAIKLSTSTEDDASGTAPAIAMYHGIGNYADEKGKEDLSTIWKWRDLTFLASPAMTYVNSKYFNIFTNGNIGDAYNVSDRFSSIEGNVKGIKSTVAETKKTVDGVETRVSTVEQKADSIKLEVDTKINGLNDGLIATGINVTSKQITLTAERTSFRTNSGEDVAVFNEDGLNADLINVKHLWAVNEDGTKNVGYFGNCETDACKVGSEYAPLFVGSATAKDAPFYVTSTGKISAMAGNIGSFAIQGGKLHEEDNEGSTTMDLGSYNLDFMDNSEDGNPRTNRFSLTMGNVAMIDTFGAVVSGGITLKKFRDFDTTSTNLYDPQVNIGLKVSVQGDVSQTIRESYQTLSSGYLNGNHALFISKGDIAGMRPVLTVATTHRALSKMECVVVCRAGVTLTLPKDPEIGQYYKIIKATKRTVTMAIDTQGGDTKKITYWYTQSLAGTETVVSKTADKCPLDGYVQDAELFFDGTEWQCRQYGYVKG